jgi:cyclic pyranopterin phosphate synthase
MPATGVNAIPHEDVLSYEELLRVARAAVSIGVEKIRVTGGEPLVRKGIIPFLEQLSLIPGLKRLVLTTNGILLPEMAAELRCAGVESLNISLDSLCPNTFSSITRGGDVTRVLEGIKAAERAGFHLIKINVVVIRGINENEVADFAALTIDKPYRVRFIEYMPTMPDDMWKMRTMPGEEVLKLVSRRFALQPVKRESMDGPATYYQIDGAAGMIGVITPVSCHFCNECNRIRVTSNGIAKSCLFATDARDLKQSIRSGSDQALKDALRAVVKDKPEHHNIAKEVRNHTSMAMSQMGG